ncbi:YlbF family regulator [Domibacillus sp. DTU_2020_1001157_1_SI_ALB_TIR_016]|uniref:YlbF family regulator n=1 Tax=Domibacillus sp. DTU_2020_1001157_1_SI_ALB_TIR_016 TaxID=3077789 RepID=UPI0028E6E7A8|nr:YlbF family regulator [Domibacillus sp. DTU_2020_1001157_1_SI_ALB_TIR_016]WNS79827.1 YlbF family regulator [Domibacillus sp. DTU_2020_1001157_1_SI_ALB_TIR_016]
MIATTMELINIADAADALGDMILQSEQAVQYRECYKKLYTEESVKHKIVAFSRLKEQYEEVQRFGRYHPDYKRIMMETRTAKREMDMDEYVAAFRRAETELQQLLDEVSLLVARSVSEQVKVPGAGSIFSSGCGSCGSGGSCGCSA